MLSPWAAVAALKASCKTSTTMFIRFTFCSAISGTSSSGPAAPGTHVLFKELERHSGEDNETDDDKQDWNQGPKRLLETLRGNETAKKNKQL